MSNWYYHDPAQGRVGPIDVDAVRGHYRAGRIRRDTLMWREGLREWQPLERLSSELGLDEDMLSSNPPPLPPDLPPELPAQLQPMAGGDAQAPSAGHAYRAQAHQAPGPGPSPARPAAPPPRRGLSGCVIVLIVLAALSIPVIGILAAIALPAYQDYTHRAKISEALLISSQLKIQVAEYVAAHDACPDNASEGFKPAAAYAGPRVAKAEIGEFEDSDRCGIQLELRGVGNDQIDGKKLWQEYDRSSGAWTCGSEIADRFLPAQCRG
ncbi:pilin [Lysobacter sp. BMK333-48F3]|uniref:pilin n=1 Tax=Lysobacter sp. BMK333-48F3 TaxID=2867962 RepID=UPI001C8C6F63|nr:pilin [Lysobacter sp. BMK333-48F3]MBX9400641.1 pilin [Lysobacter sp. BMK333-48F3]